MDIKAKVEEILAKVKGDDGFLAKFKEDPIKAIEGIIGKDLPDEQLKAIVDGVKAKLSLDKDGDGKLDIVEDLGEKAGDIGGKIGDIAGGIGEKLGGIFKKD